MFHKRPFDIKRAASFSTDDWGRTMPQSPHLTLHRAIQVFSSYQSVQVNIPVDPKFHYCPETDRRQYCF